MLLPGLASGTPTPLVIPAIPGVAALPGIAAPAATPAATMQALTTKPDVAVAGTLGLAAQYPILAQVHGVGPTLVLLVVVAVVGDTFYWTAFHAEQEHRPEPDQPGHGFHIQ